MLIYLIIILKFELYQNDVVFVCDLLSQPSGEPRKRKINKKNAT